MTVGHFPPVPEPDRGESSARRVPRLALTRAEAAEALGMSLNSFERHVQPELRLIRRDRLRLVPLGELERWIAANQDEAPMARVVR